MDALRHVMGFTSKLVIPCNRKETQPTNFTRRSLLLTCSSSSTSLLLFPLLHQALALGPADVTTRPSLRLVPYADERNGFAFSRPEEWIKVDKYGATVLFEDPAKKSNSVGVVVSPVRISSLEEFGGPEDVATKLIDAERKKPSTNAVELVSIDSRKMEIPGGASTAVYEIEYKLDSTRGMKRIYSGVTIASRKLFIINVAVAEGPNDQIDPETESALKCVVSSLRID